MMLVGLTIAALSFQPMRLSARPHSPTRRARETVALVELSELANMLPPDAFTAPTGYAPLPADFLPTAPPAPHGKPFSFYMMSAISFYILVNAMSSFGPIILRRLSGEAPPEPTALLEAVPTTSFGWVQADLRLPLPPLDGLHRHPIGRCTSTGSPLYLCRSEEATKFPSVERSLDFSEHYGEPIFVCCDVPSLRPE